VNASTSATPRQRKPRSKAQRGVRLCIKPDGTSPGVVRLTVGTVSADYFLTELPADFGRGFKVEKVGMECQESAYHVHIDGDTRSCECKGFLHHGHCKHADGLAALVAVGWL